MAEIRYGWREGSGSGKEYRAAADEYFSRLGGKFVYIHTDGTIKLCTNSSTYVAGWAETPKDTANKNAYKTSAGDNIFVITSLEGKFEMPWDEATASLTASYIGAGCTATRVGATYSMIQKAQYKATAASCLFNVVDVDTTNKTVLVQIRPSKKQPA